MFPSQTSPSLPVLKTPLPYCFWHYSAPGIKLPQIIIHTPILLNWQTWCRSDWCLFLATKKGYCRMFWKITVVYSSSTAFNWFPITTIPQGTSCVNPEKKPWLPSFANINFWQSRTTFMDFYWKTNTASGTFRTESHLLYLQLVKIHLFRSAHCLFDLSHTVCRRYPVRNL